MEYSICQTKKKNFLYTKCMEFTEILKEYLEINGLSQTAFADLVGVKQSQVSEWLRGKAKPGYDILKKISTATGISADYFLGLKDSFK